MLGYLVCEGVKETAYGMSLHAYIYAFGAYNVMYVHIVSSPLGVLVHTVYYHRIVERAYI